LAWKILLDPPDWVQLTHAGRALHPAADGRRKEVLHAAELAIRVGEALAGPAALRPRDVRREDLAALPAAQVRLPTGASWRRLGILIL